MSISFEEFAASHGAGAQGFGDAGNHRRGERHSDKTWARVLAVQRERDEALYLRRAELRREYVAKVEAGEIAPPTHKERILSKAAGNPDRADVQAARRLAEKYYGGAGLGGDYHDTHASTGR